MTYHKESGTNDGKGFRRCPRSRLREIIDSSKSKHDMDFLVGIEMEFFILTIDELKGPGPTSDTFSPGVWSTSSLLSPHLPVLEEIVRSLTQAGIDVRQFHSEGEIGLFELTAAPLPPLEAADALIFMHETVKIVCAKRGLHATMHPKPFEKKSIVGSHIHMSMTRIDREESFLAGLLEHYGALSAFWAPNYDSYFRVKPTDWVGWSLLNKTAVIRKLCPGRWEIRGPDATMNVYLVLLAIIQAGLLGFEAEKPLTHLDPKRVMWETPLTDEEVEKFKLTDKPPTTLKMALEKLKDDKALSEALGPEIVEKYLKVKNKEEEIFGKMTLSERKEMTMKIF
jgi:glutamine synthetase